MLERRGFEVAASLAIVSFVVLFSACGGGSDWDEDCHYDCFGAVECSDGVVTQFLHAPVPCEYWTGSCPKQVMGTCQRGCAVARLTSSQTCPLTICRENYPKQPGDTCTEEADCHPTVAVLGVDGGVSQTYLHCDVDGGACVETAAPPLADWLGPCEPILMSQRVEGTYGTVEDSTCTGGICYFVFRSGQDCVLQGCTRRCAVDEECPQGAVCQTGILYCPAAGSSYGYCKPGDRYLIDVGLSCW